MIELIETYDWINRVFIGTASIDGKLVAIVESETEFEALWLANKMAKRHLKITQ